MAFYPLLSVPSHLTHHYRCQFPECCYDSNPPSTNNRAGAPYNGQGGFPTDHTRRFDVLEHTADVGIVAYGSDLSELFANAAFGLFSLMVDTAGVQEEEERDIEVLGRDLETLLVRWLTELLYYLDAEEMLFSRFEIIEMTETSLHARAYGERIDRGRHVLACGVKAVTRHMLEIARENDGYRATVLFDI